MNNASENLSNLGLLLLFPGFFFWHFGLAAGLVPIQVGLYGQVSAILALIFLTYFVKRWVVVATESPFAVVALLFIGYCAAWVVAHAALGDPPPGSIWQAFAVIVSWFALLSIGVFMEPKHWIFRRILMLSWVLMAAVALWYIDGGSFIVRRAFRVDDGVATYQGFARSVMISSIILMALIETPWRRYAFTVLAIFFVFIMAARSELFGLIFAVVVLEGISALRRRDSAFALAPIGALVAVVVLWNTDLLQQSRHIRVFDPSENSSWTLRTEYALAAWEQISRNPLIGHFGGHYYVGGSGSLGSYAHNALSAWVGFGLVGFILFTGLTIWAAAVSATRLYGNDTVDTRLGLYLNASSLILIIFAKSVFWPVVALGWGVLIKQSVEARRARRWSDRERPAHGDTG